MLKRIGLVVVLVCIFVALVTSFWYSTALSPLIAQRHRVNSKQSLKKNIIIDSVLQKEEVLQHADHLSRANKNIIPEENDEQQGVKKNSEEGTTNGELHALKKRLKRTMAVVQNQNKLIHHHSELIKQMTDVLRNQKQLFSVMNKSVVETYPKIEKVFTNLQKEEHRKLIMKFSKRLNLLSTKPYQGMKFVHLDLKGAAPRIDYLLKFMKQAKQYGATGFLIEYEDMFPWSDKLSVLRRKTAYTNEELSNILLTARDLEMEIIPLIQTYGHLEFVLKHDQFKHLRRTPDDKKSINSANKHSIPLVKMLIDQILVHHPSIRWLHIGGDEVAGLQNCVGCLELEMTPEGIYQHHMIPILEYVKSKQNNKDENIMPIIWDDMMRRWPVSDIKIITKHAIPMVWAYVPDLNRHDSFPEDMWVRYAQGMTRIFFASGFKGGTASNTDLMEVDQRAKNQVGWLQIIALFEKLGRQVDGIALTGWSRFMHTFPLCELLPAGTPSLALCLEILRVGKYDSQVVKNVSKSLGVRRVTGQTQVFVDPEGYKSNVLDGNFLGADVYVLVERLARLQGIMRRMDRSFHRSTEDIRKTLNCLTELKKLTSDVQNTFPKYFYEDTVQEWIDMKIVTDMVHLNLTLERSKHKIKKVHEYRKGQRSKHKTLRSDDSYENQNKEDRDGDEWS